MNRYWDLSEQERANLTHEQVESMITVELMEKGVVKVDRPDLQDLPDVDVGKKVAYKVGYDGKYSGKDYFDCVFETPEAAQAFMALLPAKANYDYNIGSQWRYFHPVSGLCVERHELCDHTSVLNVKSLLERREAIKKANAAAMSDYNIASKAVDVALSGMWEDYHDCKDTKRRCDMVLETFREYVGICDGDKQKAMVFLSKAYNPGQLEEARKWHSDDLVGDEVMVADDCQNSGPA